MGAMKELATELELHWDGGAEHGGYTAWSRPLPDSTLAIIVEGYGKARLSINTAGRASVPVDEYLTVAEAVLAAGRIAQRQLSAQMKEWAA